MDSFCDLSIKDFLAQAGSGSPVPGGGAIAALAGALGSAMAAMAANFTIGKPRFAQHETEMREILGKLEVLTREFCQAMDADAAAFLGIAEAYRLPKETDADKAHRKEMVDAALAASMKVPMAVLRYCYRAAELLPSLAGAGNQNLLSDVEVAGIMLDAAARAARVNVLVNSSQLRTVEARTVEREAGEIMMTVVSAAAEVSDIVARRCGSA
ncbi:MAG: cyclodeaminase/cyclohydrolase family protein [Planctomycetes bacterium]|nr:cyclodeaminase/cyclohydrolase family protein [Planctomycetota bacterium]